MFGGRGGCGPVAAARNPACVSASAGLKRRSNPIVVEAGAHRGAAGRPGDMAGVRLVPVAGGDEQLERIEEAFGSVDSLDREIGRASIADEQQIVVRATARGAGCGRSRRRRRARADAPGCGSCAARHRRR
jgi:hypothetical protein